MVRKEKARRCIFVSFDQTQKEAADDVSEHRPLTNRLRKIRSGLELTEEEDSCSTSEPNISPRQKNEIKDT